MPTHNHSAWTDQQGNHSHSFSGWAMSEGIQHYPNATDAISNRGDQGYRSGTYTFWNNGIHAHNVGVSNSGSNLAHNNIPPYIVVTIWQRKS